jgi:hypothetical protein
MRNNIIGYVNIGEYNSVNLLTLLYIGDINTKFKSFEGSISEKEEVKDVATVICVRGIFTKLDYTVGQFPTKST